MSDLLIDDWYQLAEAERVPSPRVLVSPHTVVKNIDSAIRVAGSPDRLRPHIKTHKSADVIRLHLERGVSRFKCATIAETLLLAQTGCPDILLAYQPVGPALEQLHEACRKYTGARFSCLVDNLSTARAIDAAGERNGVVLGVYVDLDVGMGRTGVATGDPAIRLYEFLEESRWLEARGIHAYDGHIHDGDLDTRCQRAAESRAAAFTVSERVSADVPEIVLGGTPSFPCHAEAWTPGVALSPGTYVYSDWGYATSYPDLPFRGGAVVFGRVISARADRFTIDIGSKAIAADPAQPRGTILNIPDAVAGPQSEEHWVFSSGSPPAVGTPVYVWPTHICPTIEHHDEVLLVEEHRVTGTWQVTARGRGAFGG